MSKNPNEVTIGWNYMARERPRFDRGLYYGSFPTTRPTFHKESDVFAWLQTQKRFTVERHPSPAAGTPDTTSLHVLAHDDTAAEVKCASNIVHAGNVVFRLLEEEREREQREKKAKEQAEKAKRDAVLLTLDKDPHAWLRRVATSYVIKYDQWAGLGLCEVSATIRGIFVGPYERETTLAAVNALRLAIYDELPELKDLL